MAASKSETNYYQDSIKYSFRLFLDIASRSLTPPDPPPTPVPRSVKLANPFSASQGIHYFVQMHLDGAGVKDCDHWHDDAGKLEEILVWRSRHMLR